MAGIIFPDRSLRINRRRFVGGASVLTGGLLLGGHAGPVLAAEPPATGLRDLLALIPAKQAANAASSGVLFYYADLQAQFAKLGVDPSSSASAGDLMAAVLPLAIASQAFQYAYVQDFATTFGYKPLEIQRTIFYGTPPDELTIMEGGFDADAVIAALKKSGFKKQKAPKDVDFWSFSTTGEVDLSSPVGTYGVGAFSNAAIIDGTYLVWARTAALVQQIIDQYGSGDASMLDQAGVKTTLDTFGDDVVSIIATTSTFLEGATSPSLLPNGAKDPLAGSDKAVGKMPAIRTAMFGIRAGAVAVTADNGGTPEATPEPDATPETAASSIVQVRLEADAAATAKQVVKVVTWRWDHLESLYTEKPYSAYMKLEKASVARAEPTVAVFNFDAGSRGAFWTQMINIRDLLPFAPSS